MTRRHLTVPLAVLLVTSAVDIRAQSALGERLRFEVASVKTSERPTPD